MLPAGLASGENSSRLVDSYLVVGHQMAFPLCVHAKRKDETTGVFPLIGYQSYWIRAPLLRSHLA